MAATGLPMLGWLPRQSRLRIPERHLGLVPGGEHLNPATLIAEIAAEIDQRFDIAAVIDVARTAADLPRLSGLTDVQPVAHHQHGSRHPNTRRSTVAVARDAAFCFYYPENLELLQEAGATIEFFSPLLGEFPSAAAAGVYLGGGYPELHGPALASNAGLWRALQELRARDAPIYAECGGFMVLTQALIDRDGHRWPMAGLIPGAARMTDSLAALGYRHATALRPNLLTDDGDVLRGHEFRYSTWVQDEPMAADRVAWQMRGTRTDAPIDAAGFADGNLLASYLHIHFGQRAGIAHRFVEKLRPGI